MSTAAPIGTIGATAPAATTNTSTANTTGIDDAGDKDMFLKLLIAQMKYQDPSAPTDSTTYVTQMAQFSEVEKLQSLVDSQTTLTTATQLGSAVSMIGDTVAYGAGSTGGTGKVTGVTVLDGVPQLLIGTAKVKLEDVTGVTAPAATTTATPATDGSKATT